jgi:D-glycero-D-manno-heptose 1,7-bisphosphate phosphatase
MKLIVLDRDGVINEDSDDYIKSVDEWHPIPDSLEAIARLNHAGYTVAVATNQSGIARGFYDVATLSAMHRKMDDLLASLGGKVDAVFFCPHGPKDGCDCRKPEPGLLRQIGERYQHDMKDVIFIGDSISDMKAAVAIEAQPVLVKTGKGEESVDLLYSNGIEGALIFDNLADAVDAIVDRES